MLLDHGHPDAGSYTLARVEDEVAIVIERLNYAVITNALAFQTAYVAARTENGKQLMGDFIERLTSGD